ncbi:MAG: hypothetical protein ACOY0R_03610 [Chloroflexota bacterium]
MTPGKTFDPDAELTDLEAHLAGTLKPLATSDGLSERLRRRIHIPQRSEIMLRFNEWRSLFLALGGALSGILLFITVARALFHLVGRRSG